MSEDAQKTMKADWRERAKDGGQYSETGSSAHYKDSLIEFIDDVERQYGTVVAYLTCVVNEHKYRSRAGKKIGVPVEKDMVKAKWYMHCGRHLHAKIHGLEMPEHETYGRPYIEAPAQVLNLFDNVHHFCTLQHVVDTRLKQEK